MNEIDLYGYFQSISTQNIERVEVLMSPPARYDAEGVAGIINVVLKENENAHWHRVTDADEIWLWHLGDPLLLSYSDERSTKEITLGPDLNNNEELQAVIPKSIWQKAKSNGAWSLVSCVVAPAFSFDGFEMAKKGWEPKA